MIYYKTSELYHHGILGQKWGVRNGPPYPLKAGAHSAREKKAGWKRSLAGSNNTDDSSSQNKGTSKTGLSEEDKKALIKAAVMVAATAGVYAGMYYAFETDAVYRIAQALQGSSKLSSSEAKKVALEALDETTNIFKQGDVLHRMSAYANLDYTTSDKPMYTAYDKQDVAKYMTMLKDWSGTGQRFDVSFEAAKDLKIPTREKAKEIFMDLYKNDPEFKEALIDNIYRQYAKIGTPLSKQTVAAEIARDVFGKTSYSMVIEGKHRDIIVNKLKSSGFDAIKDYFDADEKFTDNPLIVLDPSSSLRKTGERIVTKQLATKTLYNLDASGIKQLRYGKGFFGDLTIGTKEFADAVKFGIQRGPWK